MTYHSQNRQPTPTTTITPAENLPWLIAEAADDRKAADITILRVSELSYLTDYFVIATGFSKTQVRAIATSIKDKVEDLQQKTPLRVQGESEGSWVVLDYGDVIVHIMLPAEREYYNLEAFWGHAERLEFPG